VEDGKLFFQHINGLVADLRPETQNINIALSCRLSFDAISTYILAYSLQKMYHG
jgi:hypothetical protein